MKGAADTSAICMKKIVMTGGGTAGHVTPNLALIPHLREEGFEISYIGSIDGMEKKQKMLSYFYRTLFRLMGYKRYVMFLKSLYFYCRPEMHTFLIKSKSNQL